MSTENTIAATTEEAAIVGGPPLGLQQLDGLYPPEEVETACTMPSSFSEAKDVSEGGCYCREPTAHTIEGNRIAAQHGTQTVASGEIDRPMLPPAPYAEGNDLVLCDVCADLPGPDNTMYFGLRRQGYLDMVYNELVRRARVGDTVSDMDDWAFMAYQDAVYKWCGCGIITLHNGRIAAMTDMEAKEVVVNDTDGPDIGDVEVNDGEYG